MNFLRFIYSFLRLQLRLIYLFLTNRKIRCDQFRHSFDLVSLRFDPDWENHTWPTIENLFSRATLRSAHTFLDLGCDTGRVAIYLGKEYRKAKVYVLSFSAGIIDLVQKRTSELNITNEEFVCGELVNSLKKFPNETFDQVFYVFPQGMPVKSIFKEIYRVLKKGGLLGLLIQTENSAPELKKIWHRLRLKYAAQLRNVISCSLPDSLRSLKRQILSVGLRVLESWPGEIKIAYSSGTEALEKMLNSGLLVGYDQCLDLRNDEPVKKDFVQLFEKKGNSVTHHYFGIVAEKRLV